MRDPFHRPEDPDARLLRRAARTVAVQTAAAVAIVVLTMAGAILLVDEHQQHRQADQVSRSTWARADDVDDPPEQTWLVVQTASGHREVTPGAPAAVRRLRPATLRNGSSRIALDGRKFILYTGNRKIGRVSAVYGLSAGELEDRRLQVSIIFAALLGVLGAAAVGALIGRRAVRPLGRALALQRRFVADASHELRTPLSVLLLRAQLLQRHLGPVAPERGPELNRLVNDTKVLSDVVSDMLLSVELEHRPHAGELVDLAALAADVTESLQPLAERGSVELIPKSNPDQQVSPYLVNGASAALRRAIVSLVDNAISHTPSGGHVSVEVSADLGQVTLSVKDDGEGLDPAAASRLVERFSRGTTNNPGRRFGLGLALVDEIARAHGGTLIVAGEPGRGASFSLSLPAA
jgi:signal transduction histidine kinase